MSLIAEQVYLDAYNCDINFVIESDGVSGSSLHKNGFEYIWAGGRATRGVSRGKVYYVYIIIMKRSEWDWMLEFLPVLFPSLDNL